MLTQQRVAIFMPSVQGGGGERTMLNLAGGLAGRGCAVDVVLARAQGVFLPNVPASVRLIDLHASRSLTSLPAAVAYLRREQPAAMISVFGYFNIVALWAWRLAHVRTKLFVNEQNTVSLEAGHASSWRLRMTPHLMRRFYPWASGIVVVSEGVRDDMARSVGIPRERISVIYNPSVVAADVQEKARMPLDDPWFAPGQPPVLVAVGRLHPQKDFPMLIDAFAQVRRTRDARLLILGEGKERAMLEARVRERGLEDDVRMPGFVMNPYAYMARSAAFVLSSQWEGLPTVVVEALCCGTPVVATDCPSGPREILRDGEYGALVPVGDADALAGAVRRTLEHRATPPPRSWQPYELQTVVDQYLHLLLGE